MYIKKKMLKKKIRYCLKFQSYDQNLLVYNFLVSLFELKKNLNFIHKNTYIILPYKTKKICLLRSPFVDNVSIEHFELRIFKNILIIEILDPKNFLLEKIFDNYLINILKFQEVTISYKKFKIVS